MFRNAEDKVAQLFQKNKNANSTKEVELVDPLKIKIDPNNLHREESNQSEKDKERIVSQARQRYVHEKKIIVFIMHTCRKLRNLAKQRNIFHNASNGLMFAGLLLLKKGIILNETAIDTLKHKANTYQLYNFEYFLTTNNCTKIQAELTKDNKLYYTLLSHLQRKLQQEIGLNDPRSREIYNISADTNSTIQRIEPELRKETHFLVEFQSQRGHTFSSEINKELSIGLAHLFLSSESSNEFSFKKNGIPFDWRQFEQNLTLEYVNTVLRRAMSR